MKILFYTLGCRVNQAESGGMGALLRERGHEIVSQNDIPDAVIVNTCTVTASADRKSLGAIRRMRERYPDALLCVCGCLSQTEGLKEMAGIDLIAGSGRKSAFIDALELLAEGNRGGLSSDLLSFPDTFDPLPAAPPEGRTRVFLKIQDGCENHCSYCRIPAARGPSRSRPEEETLEMTRRAAQYAPELVLCGIEISSYAPSLIGLAEKVCLAVPHTRVRIGSIDPRTPDDDFCRRLSALPNLCPHFHLSLQSCSDRVLSRMGRRYHMTEIEVVFENLRRFWKNPALTADILTGFPGESEGEYEETFSALQRLRPAGLHVFPYSRRKDTKAAVMPGQLTAAQKSERAGKLIALGRELRAGYMASFCGTFSKVLYESEKKGLWLGHTPEYVPVYTQSPLDLNGVTAQTELVSAGDNGFLGRLAD